MIAAGKLDQHITFQEAVRTPNGSGGFDTTYATVLETFASVRELRSDPTLIAQQEDIKQVVEVIIRYRPDIPIVNGNRAVWRGFNFTVNNMRVDPRRTSITMLLTSEIETSSRTEGTT